MTKHAFTKAAIVAANGAKVVARDSAHVFASTAVGLTFFYTAQAVLDKVAALPAGPIDARTPSPSSTPFY